MLGVAADELHRQFFHHVLWGLLPDGSDLKVQVKLTHIFLFFRISKLADPVSELECSIVLEDLFKGNIRLVIKGEYLLVELRIIEANVILIVFNILIEYGPWELDSLLLYLGSQSIAEQVLFLHFGLLVLRLEQEDLIVLDLEEV